MEAGRSPTRDPSHSHGNRGVGEVSSVRVDSDMERQIEVSQNFLFNPEK